jgi:AcrR family transcriptional regulator
LAKKLGVTQPLLYRYVPSKDDLISEVYETVYASRWQSEWEALLADRSRPLRERLNDFYNRYTDVIFDDKWMRIFLFSGLKGVDINRRYLQLVRKRILEPIVAEGRAEFGLVAEPARDCELEYVWVMHGGIFYYGVRQLIYESAISDNKSQIIHDAIEAFVAGLEIKLSRNKR